MKPQGPYARAVLKLSGDAFAPESSKGLDERQVAYIARELLRGHEVCPSLAVVVGGGNIMRGAKFRSQGLERIRADYAGMIATVINALVLQDHLESAGVPCSIYSALPVSGAVDPFDAERCRETLSQRRIAILAGGTGNPLFTTDTAAALRAVELGAQVLLKATRVEGVHSADPELEAEAELFRTVTYEEVLRRKLAVMDLCAVSICMEHRLPLRVFNYKVEGNIRRALMGESVGTLVGSQEDVS